MSMIRFAIFVDGSNLVGSLRKLGVDLLPEDCEQFYRNMFNAAASIWKSTFHDGNMPPAQLSRVYWYVLGSMDSLDFTDASLETRWRVPFEKDDIVYSVYWSRALRQGLEANPEDGRNIAWSLFAKDVKSWYFNRKKTLDDSLVLCEKVRSAADFIDVIECGHWSVDAVHRTMTEKGVDTRLAVDMVTMIDNYDVAIVVSGDADSIPGINYVKSRGRHVAVVQFLRGTAQGRRGHSTSKRLQEAADFVVPIYGEDLSVEKTPNLKSFSKDAPLLVADLSQGLAEEFNKVFGASNSAQ